MTIKKAAIIAAAAGIIWAAAFDNDDRRAEYVYTVQNGDTLWTICERINDGRENLNALVYDTRERNGIKNGAALQPGDIIRVSVKID